MTIDVTDYSDAKKAIQWLDIDPSFDGDWIAWSTLRTYAFVPGLKEMLGPLSPVPYQRLASLASSMQAELHEAGGYSGLLKHENLTAEQMKYIVGTLKNEQGQPKPLRLDKALLGVYAINHELDRMRQPTIRPTIYLSAFSIRGVSRRFNELERDAKVAVREGLSEAIDQSPQFASELLKGNKVSLDAAIGAFGFLSKHESFKKGLTGSASGSIETPSQRHTAAAQYEDFSRGRISTLPEPFRRPTTA